MDNQPALDLESPVDELPVTGELPTKPFYESQAFWVSAIGILAGLLQQNEALAPIAQFLQLNGEKLVGWVMTGLGFWGLYATLTRKTVLTKGR
jgi:hypothetical protein